MKKSHDFPGPDYDPEVDNERLESQHDSILSLMKDGQYRTLGEISSALRYPEASVSAQLRHLRKPDFGSYVVDKRRRGDRSDGLYEYRVRKGRVVKK